MTKTASANQIQGKTALEPTNWSNDPYYKKLDYGEKQIFKDWLTKNTDGTPQKFFELREAAKSKRKMTPTEGVISHDGTFVTEITREEAKNLHEIGNHLAREIEQG